MSSLGAPLHPGVLGPQVLLLEGAHVCPPHVGLESSAVRRRLDSK